MWAESPAGVADAGPIDLRELSELGERAIFQDMLAPRYGGSPSFGDDCAPLGRGLVVTTDACPTPMVEQLGVDDPFYAGWLLATINLSDLAAAGADPVGLMVSYTLPRSTSVAALKQLMKGVDSCAEVHGTTVLGGDMRDGPRHLSATAIGRSRRSGRVLRTGLGLRAGLGMRSGRVSRRGARAGDRLLLVGDPGYLWASALLHHGWATLDGDAAAIDAVTRKARQPMAQLRAGRMLASRGLTRAALDVSDGLFASVSLLGAANGLGALMHPEIELDPLLRRVCDEAKVSSFQLGQTWGDWCLLVAVRSGDAARTLKLLSRSGIGAREVGVLRHEPGLYVGDERESRPWDGVDQERFTESSWNGSGVVDQLERMRERSAFGD